MTKDLAPKPEEVLAERVNWINRATELAANDNWHAVHEALCELDDEHLRSMIYVLVLARGHDLRRARDAMAYGQFDGLGSRGSVTLN
jgi:hypothetical protein